MSADKQEIKDAHLKQLKPPERMLRGKLNDDRNGAVFSFASSWCSKVNVFLFLSFFHSFKCTLRITGCFFVIVVQTHFHMYFTWKLYFQSVHFNWQLINTIVRMFQKKSEICCKSQSGNFGMLHHCNIDDNSSFCFSLSQSLQLCDNDSQPSGGHSLIWKHFFHFVFEYKWCSFNLWIRNFFSFRHRTQFLIEVCFIFISHTISEWINDIQYLI